MLLTAEQLEIESDVLIKRIMPELINAVKTAINMVNPENFIENDSSKEEYYPEAEAIAKIIADSGTENLEDKIQNVFQTLLGK